ncbi:hypothetical protein NX905_29430 [Burkholderia thailandensis]|nr:hypothetical protein [Burkholderia thailandensis]MCS6498314.1 hypothetical protein [Burkholderia thailandensis]
MEWKKGEGKKRGKEKKMTRREANEEDGRGGKPAEGSWRESPRAVQ